MRKTRILSILALGLFGAASANASPTSCSKAAEKLADLSISLAAYGSVNTSVGDIEKKKVILKEKIREQDITDEVKACLVAEVDARLYPTFLTSSVIVWSSLKNTLFNLDTTMKIAEDQVTSGEFTQNRVENLMIAAIADARARTKALKSTMQGLVNLQCACK